MNPFASAMSMETLAVNSTPSNGGRLVSTDGLALPLERSHLGVTAGGGVARTTLEQRFRNPHERPLVVTYLLPLPANGAVSGFSFRMGETHVIGEVDTKKVAKERFERAIVQGKTAALIEQERSSLFTQKVGNIPPGQEIVCEVIVDQRLDWLPEGAWEWRFPTVVGTRYMGAAGRVQDADKLTVAVADKPLPERLTLALSIDDALAEGRRPESPSHDLRVTGLVSNSRDSNPGDRNPGDSNPIDVCFAGDRSVRLDRDVVIRWAVAKPAVGLSLDSARPSADAHRDRAYGLLTIVPPVATARPRPLPRDLIVLIDTSGSMGGRPLTQAKRVVCAMIDTLTDDDRIELIEFGSRPVRFRAEPVAATRDGRQQATKWVKKLRSSGATEMHEAVLEALRPLRSGCQRQVVLITDGFIGFESEIVQAILDHLPPNCRLHTIGVGSAPNRSLTRPAARAGAGVELIIDMDEDAEHVARRLLERTTAPLVTDLAIEGFGNNARVLDVRPQRLPDLFAGSPVLVSLALEPGSGPLKVRGTMAGGGVFEHTIETSELALGQGNQAIAALYGRELVEDLETRACARGNTSDIDLEIEHAGLDFQISTRMTSWVAVTEEVTVTPGERIDETMPHETPYGTSIQGFGLRGAAPSGAKLSSLLGGLPGGMAGKPSGKAGSKDDLAPEDKKRRKLSRTATLSRAPAPSQGFGGWSDNDEEMNVDAADGPSAGPGAGPGAGLDAGPHSGLASGHADVSMPAQALSPESMSSSRLYIGASAYMSDVSVLAAKKRGNPWLRLLLLVLLVVAVAFGLWYWLASSPPAPATTPATTSAPATAPVISADDHDHLR